MEEKLWQACSQGRVEEVRKLLQNSQININWQDPELSRTPFFRACGYSGHIEIVKLLLNDERVDINKANKYGTTPFYIACYSGHIEIVKLLLNDNRVDVNKANDEGATPFFVACCHGLLEVVKYMLLCGREIDFNKKWNNKTSLDISKQRSTSTQKFSNETEEEFQKAKRNCPKIVELIESFQRNPNETRAKLRKQLGLSGKFFLLTCLFIICYFFSHFFFKLFFFFFFFQPRYRCNFPFFNYSSSL